MILIVPCKVLCSIAIVLLSLLTAAAGHDNTASTHRSPWLCFLSALIGDGDGGGRCYFVMSALSLLLHQPSLVAAVREMEGGNQGRICWAPLTRTLDWGRAETSLGTVAILHCGYITTLGTEAH